MSKLIFETGKCKMQGFDYPVHIYATNGGACGDLIFGAYKSGLGWEQITWNKNGTSMLNMASLSLVPIPQFYYFSLYESNRGNPTTSSFVASINELPEQGSGSTRLLGTYKYTDGLIEKVEELDNEI